MSKKDPRDMVGYGSKDKKIRWPNNARIAGTDSFKLRRRC
jgi:hypothetical protein